MMANAAVAAVKKGCQLYKEIKGAAGDVSEVLKDLKEQFHKVVDPTPAQKMQYNAEVQRVQEIAKADPADVFTDIGNQLGALLDAQDQLSKALLAEEIANTTVYKGQESLGRRALRKIIIESRLDSMMAELRETMVYRAPPELGSLWGKYEKTVERINKQQEVARIAELKLLQIAANKRRHMIRRFHENVIWFGAVLFVTLWLISVLILIKTSKTAYLGYY